MLGLMQRQNLLVSALLNHAERHHGTGEIVSVLVAGETHRTTYAGAAARARMLARVLARLGIGYGDRVGSLAWNSYRHFELYYAVSGSGAVMHTVNPRLHDDDIAYIIAHAEDRLLFVDTSFAELVGRIAPAVAGSVRAVVFMTDAAHMPDLALPAGMDKLCYETLMAGEPDAFDWPDFDENTANALCYTSGTTGRPKGVLYSHRSTVLHAMTVNTADAMALRAVDRVMPVVPMFHVNAWGLPYAAPMAGASLIMPGRFLDGASLERLVNAERVTVSLGVPTVWMGLLAHLAASGGRIPTMQRVMTGGSACPPALMETFWREHGVQILHAWGSTEASPVATFSEPKAAHAGLSVEALMPTRLKQGRAVPFVDMKIVNDAGDALPWDGVQFGEVKLRGPWVTCAYFGSPEGSACDADGWFATGDVGTIDADGFMAITDRSKDVIKSGGEWISSIALENIAVSHPDVAEAAVIAARHPKWDERPLLLILPKPGRSVARADLLPLYEGRVPRWWLPDEVLTVDALPHTATGKLLKTALRAKYQDHYMRTDG